MRQFWTLDLDLRLLIGLWTLCSNWSSQHCWSYTIVVQSYDFMSIWKEPAISLTLTHVVPKGPRLIQIKMNIALSVCFGVEGMCKNAPWAIKGQVVSMPVPACEWSKRSEQNFKNISHLSELKGWWCGKKLLSSYRCFWNHSAVKGWFSFIWLHEMCVSKMSGWWSQHLDPTQTPHLLLVSFAVVAVHSMLQKLKQKNHFDSYLKNTITRR